MRAQAHTLEGFVASMLVLGGVVFAIQATAVTPLSASTSNQHIEAQQRAQAADLLTAAAENGTLRPAVVTAGNGTYASGGPPNQFGRYLNETFGDERIAFNVRVSHSSGREQIVDMGEPTDNAVQVRHTVIVYDDTPIPGSSETVGEAAPDDFYTSDAVGDSELFDVMEVHVVVWRI